MKKIIISALFAILATASVAMATSTWTNDSGSPTQSGDIGSAGALGSTSFSVSTKVTLIADGSTAGYNCGAKHISGDTGYVSASNNAGIKEISIAKATAMASSYLTSDNGATFTE